MIVIWTIIVLLTPMAPSPDAFRDLCKRTGGGDFKMQAGALRVEPSGWVYQTLTIHCIAPKKTEKKKVQA